MYSHKELNRIAQNYYDGRATRDAVLVALYNACISTAAVKYPCQDYEDIGGEAFLEVATRIDTWDPSMSSFHTYCYGRMFGAMQDIWRRRDRYPRRVRQLKKNMGEYESLLATRLNRLPNDLELEKVSKKPLEDVRYALTIPEASDVQYEVLDEGNHSIITPSQNWDMTHSHPIWDTYAIGEAMTTLDERSRKIIDLYYFWGLSISEIGDYIGLDDSRVSRLHTLAKKELRKSLTKINLNPEKSRDGDSEAPKPCPTTE